MNFVYMTKHLCLASTVIALQICFLVIMQCQGSSSSKIQIFNITKEAGMSIYIIFKYKICKFKLPNIYNIYEFS